MKRSVPDQLWIRFPEAQVYVPRENPTFRNPPWDVSSLKVLIVRLSQFADVDKSSSHLFLAQSVRNAVQDAYIDMAFFPSEHARNLLIAEDAPLMHGIQSLNGPLEFDLILVSNSFVLELLNLCHLLRYSGLPLHASERENGYPPLILGGSNAAASHVLFRITRNDEVATGNVQSPTDDPADGEPAGIEGRAGYQSSGEAADCIADAVFFGEGEGAVETIVSLVHANRGGGKRDTLACLAREIPALWVYGFLSLCKTALTKEPEQHMLTQYPILNGPEAATGKLQISYGCPSFCSFCFEGWERKPYRELSFDALMHASMELKKHTGCSTLELLSFNMNTHSDIFALFSGLNRHFPVVNFMSQRVDILDTIPGLIDAEFAAEKRSYTLGIEGISERQRRYFHKSLENRHVESVLKKLLRAGARELKLFFLLAGNESEADMEEFRIFLRFLKTLKTDTGAGTRIVFSFGLLVRMPLTPLQYERLLLEEHVWKPITSAIKCACETMGFEYRNPVFFDEYCVSQVLCMGGFLVHEALLAMAERNMVYGTALDSEVWPFLKGWLVSYGLWNETFLGEKPHEYEFPFMHVDAVVSSEYLYRRFRDARNANDAGYCLGRDCGGGDDTGTCFACGACETDDMKRRITSHRFRTPATQHSYISELKALMQKKQKAHLVYVPIFVPRTIAGAGQQWLASWALRELFKRMPTLADTVLCAQECVFSVKTATKRFPYWYGTTVFGFRTFDPEQFIRTVAECRGGVSVQGGGTSLPRPAALGHADSPVQGGYVCAQESSTICETDSDFIVGGPLPDFDPQAPRWFEAELFLSYAEFPDSERAFVSYLHEEHVPATVRRKGAEYSLDIPAKARKNKVCRKAAYRREETGTLFTVYAGPRFDFSALFRKLGMRGCEWKACAKLSIDNK